MFKEKFDFVFSLGGNCASAMFLNETKLRMASSPFDWIVANTLKAHIDTLCTRFRDFLLRENVVWHGPGRGDRGNDVYRDNAQGYLFVHDFPKGMSLDESFPKVRAKYDRRIARLLKRLDEGSKACLVWWRADICVPDDECRDGIERVRAAFPNSDCRLLVFENDKSFGRGEWTEEELSPNCIKIRGLIDPDGSDVLGDKELNVRLYRRIGVGGRLAAERRRFALARALARVLSFWFPSRAMRKRVREALEARFLRKGESGAIGW